ncbi:bifunctional precorrin-2 dehydrogenase/sirohydrochlorin ferrochelatase [Paenibacillus sp. SYP-B3998]|uniref:precorrin-2 dehydrogenase n=1 Tax=Paenibacillus sp. SYP-B3998 TaxID=2678564 RepID=A0A6G3ZRY6_9BACL|nr:NAD(P)-dependent oxidoreductase [Paenibacillus sp. SYP-B3998]NEW04474.1 bifunctional precorrin-2 dehydrogenase/sirohydrochlorin ferrochelatase [Paenibacillus sp. SYP-B3998]
MKHKYPIMLNVEGRRCLVVGGGSVAERKIRSLLSVGALVAVLSPEVTEGLVEMACRGEVVLYRQTFSLNRMSEILSVTTSPFMLVVAATNVAEVNTQVYEAAISQGLLVNVVDQPELSSFIAPSVIRRGKLVIAVSTGGASPSAARKIAKELEHTYGTEYEVYFDFLSEVRLKVQKQIADKETRQILFREMLEWDVLTRIRSSTFELWKDELYTLIDKEPGLSAIAAFGRQVQRGGVT